MDPLMRRSQHREQIRSLNKSIAELEKTIGEEGSKLEGSQESAEHQRY